MEVSVIVPARDAEPTLGPALAALRAQQLPVPFEVLVVDDGSRDATARIALEAGEPVRLVPGPGAGPAAARNAGAALAAGAVLAFTDADCVPQPGWLAAGLRALERADLVQGAVTPPPHARRGRFDRTVWVTGPSPLFESANLFVTRELFDRLGGFEGWLGPREGKELGEDTWLGWRARRAGARVAFAPGALVHHAVLPRGPAGYVAERARLRHFPALAARIPELRSAFFWRRWFLSRRSAAFDLALAGGLVALATGRRGAVAAAVPYAVALGRDGRPWAGPRFAAATAVEAAADAVACGALLAGSAAHRSLLL